MACLGEIEDAIHTLGKKGISDILLLHCVTRYPAPIAEMNLRVITTLRAAFGYPVGFSDHSLGITAPAVALAIGACAIEKHLTLDRGLPGPDHRASLEPAEFRDMVRLVREVESGLGTGVKEIAGEEAEIRLIARRSLVAARDIPEGILLGSEMIASKRPGTGIPPKYRDSLVGKRSRVAIPKDTLLSWEMVE
jgi:N,N'-diacetyllegionaminate synthase